MVPSLAVPMAQKSFQPYPVGRGRLMRTFCERVDYGAITNQTSLFGASFIQVVW
jgi:hypothetical protein